MTMSDGAVARLKKKAHGLNEKRKQTRGRLDAMRNEMLRVYPPAGVEFVRVDTATYMRWLETLKQECAR
jgi:hypothetical protein